MLCIINVLLATHFSLAQAEILPALQFGDNVTPGLEKKNVISSMSFGTLPVEPFFCLLIFGVLKKDWDAHESSKIV